MTRSTPRLSLVVPVFNEAKYLSRFLPQIISGISQITSSFEIILSENGSTDNTLVVAKKIIRPHANIKIISSPNANYGLAVKDGFLAATGKYLVLFDLDYFDFEFVKSALKLFPENQAVVASKNTTASKDKRSFPRRLISRFFTVLLKLGFNFTLSDTHGIKVLDRLAVTPLIHQCRMTREIFDTELLIRCQQARLKLAELPVVVEEKRQSRSSILRRIFRTLRDLSLLKLYLIRENVQPLPITTILTLCLSLAVIVAMLPSLRLPFSLIDDGYNLEASVKIHQGSTHLDWSKLSWIFKEPETGRVRPFYWISLYLRYLLVGTSPLGFRLFNLCIFLSLHLLLYRLIVRLFKSPHLAFFTNLGILFYFRTAENYYRLGPQEPLMLLLLIAGFYFYPRRIAFIALFLAFLTKEIAIFVLPLLLIFAVYSLFARRAVTFFLVGFTGAIYIFASKFIGPQTVDYAANYQLNPAILQSTFQQYLQLFDASWVTPLLKISLAVFAVNLFTKSIHKSSLIGLAWFVLAFFILLPWPMAFGRYLYIATPGLFLFLLSQTKVVWIYTKKYLFPLPVFLLLLYYWSNFAFTNTLQTFNILSDHAAKEIAAAKMLTVLSQIAKPNEPIYFNSPDDPNYYEWIDGVTRNLNYVYNRPDLKASILPSPPPTNGLVLSWSFIPATPVSSLTLSTQSHTASQRQTLLRPFFKTLLSGRPTLSAPASTYTWTISSFTSADIPSSNK